MAVRELRAVPATSAAFAPFGTLVLPGADGDAFGAADAQLDLTQGCAFATCAHAGSGQTAERQRMLPSCCVVRCV